ncbi:MAG: TonB-dependent receptor [Candidatus Glassbacteria bacterium]|nr:TonB-dependent receptor [Candidatus Glassbacteria bacterium]
MNGTGYNHKIWPAMLLMVLLLWSPGGFAQGFTEEMIFQPIQTVITAGRIEQRIERAPATVTVISAEEIRASGALNIPELLRLVPGLDVTTVSASHFEVNARGLNQILSNKLLVLIDGRSAYFDFFGGVIWPALQIVIDQIDRIEVVRSPSSALYGANAFSGVINIITKNPRQINGTKINFRTGQQATLYASVMHGQRFGDTSLRFAFGARQMDSFGKPAREFENNILGNIYLEHRFDSQQRLSVEGGVIDGSVSQNVRLMDNEFEATTSYAKLNYEYGDFSLQTFWNRGNETGDPFFLGTDDVEILYNTFDIEAQQTLELANKHVLVVGGTYRYNTIESNIIDTNHDQNLLAAYFQDEYRPIPEVSLLGGARIDHHPLVGTSFSPRGSIIYAPTSRHTFRTSVGRAFRNPSFTDSYFELDVPLPPSPLLPPHFTLVGKPDLESEKITTYELGYTFFPRHFFRAEIDLFAYSFKDYIGVDSLLPNQSTGRLEQSFINKGSAKNYGFEVTFDVLPAPWMKISANYSYQDLTNNYSVLESQAPPSHKANLKAFMSLPYNFSTYCSVSRTGESTWEVPTNEGDYQVIDSKPNTRLDARISWQGLNDHAEFFLAAYNLKDYRYREYPRGEEVRRRMTTGFQLTF